jgi:hypothetical protein
MTGKNVMSLSKELSLHASRQSAVVARHRPVSGTRGKVFSVSLCDVTVEDLFRNVFYSSSSSSGGGGGSD